uniref:Uncharacterized protein n=1 Tax=Romanomermis culicivorax TaxID=13658 RepID=A0A915JGR9_ROMCU
MAAVISIYPYDPGTDVKHRRNVHGIKSYHFWPSQDEELLDHKKDVGFSIPDGQSPLELPPKTLSAFYFLIQLFVRYCLTCLKRVAVTVKIYSIPNNKGPGEKKLEKLAAGNYDHGWEDVEKLADCRDEGDEKISSTAVKPNLIELEVDQNEMREKSHNFGGYLDKFDF